MVTIRRTTPFLALALAVALAACGGSSGGTTAPAGTTAASAAVPTTAVEASTAASTPPAEASSVAGAAGVCELAIADELAAAFGVPAVTTSVIPGPPDACAVASDAGRPLASWSHTTSGAGTIYDSVVLPGQSTEVPGLGDRAAFVENMGLLILKGDSMVVITISGGADLDEAASQEVAKRIGGYIAGRM